MSSNGGKEGEGGGGRRLGDGEAMFVFLQVLLKICLKNCLKLELEFDLDSHAFLQETSMIGVVLINAKSKDEVRRVVDEEGGLGKCVGVKMKCKIGRTITSL